MVLIVGEPAKCRSKLVRLRRSPRCLEINVVQPYDVQEASQRIAGHADSRTTKLYDRRGQKILLEGMERIRY
jgi:hypothetical protein